LPFEWLGFTLAFKSVFYSGSCPTFRLSACKKNLMSDYTYISAIPYPVMGETVRRRDYYTDHACPGYAFRAICFETLGRFSPSAMQLLCEAFPQPGHQRAACFANAYRQLSVVQCRYLSRMLTAAAGLHTARTDTGRIHGALHATPEILH
jgi:hypothetical protein